MSCHSMSFHSIFVSFHSTPFHFISLYFLQFHVFIHSFMSSIFSASQCAPRIAAAATDMQEIVADHHGEENVILGTSDAPWRERPDAQRHVCSHRPQLPKPGDMAIWAPDNALDRTSHGRRVESSGAWASESRIYQLGGRTTGDTDRGFPFGRARFTYRTRPQGFEADPL